VVHEVGRNHDPEGVQEDKVAPVVEKLRARVRQVENVVVKQGSGVVEDVAVELAERDDELGRVAERVVDGDEVGGEEGARAPEDLFLLSVVVRGRRSRSSASQACVQQ